MEIINLQKTHAPVNRQEGSQPRRRDKEEPPAHHPAWGYEQHRRRTSGVNPAAAINRLKPPHTTNPFASTSGNRRAFPSTYRQARENSKGKLMIQPANQATAAASNPNLSRVHPADVFLAGETLLIPRDAAPARSTGQPLPATPFWRSSQTGYARHGSSPAPATAARPNLSAREHRW